MGGLDLGIDGLGDVEVLGHGGFSWVYAATDLRLRRRVAVKVLNEIKSDQDRRRFDRECEVLGRLSSHPNIVTVHAAGYTASSLPYLIMEYVEGGTVHDLLEREGPITWQRAVRYAIPIANALAAAHAENVLHRDVKPENILLQGEKPLLADFGIAQLRDRSGYTSTKITASWLHTPPETFDDKRDERSDLYSLASTLYTLIKGDAPFSNASDTSLNPLFRRLMFDAAPPLPDALAPAQLQAVLDRCLSKDPDDRPATAVELTAQLEALVEVEPPSPSPAPGPARSTVAIRPVAPAAPSPVDGAAAVDPTARTVAAASGPPPESTHRSMARRLAVGAVVVVMMIGAAALVRAVGNDPDPTETADATAAAASPQTSSTIEATTVTSASDPTTTTAPPTTTSPTTAAPTTREFASTVPQEWEGTFDQFNYGTYPMVMRVESLDGMAFTALTSWPTLRNSVTAVEGLLVEDFSDFVQQTRWRLVPTYRADDPAQTCVTFSDRELVQGSGISLDNLYLACLTESGESMQGVYFSNPDSGDPSGSFELTLDR